MRKDMNIGNMGMVFKVGLALFVLLMLQLGYWQYRFFIMHKKPLYGIVETSEKPSWTYESWFTAKFQREFEHWFNQNVGFRSFLVRLNNQMQYWLYNKTNAKDVQVGKDGYLFEGGYIRDYMGLNFIGEATINGRVRKLKRIQKDLEQKGITFILTFAPGKASYFPEYLPSAYDTGKRTISNYQSYLKSCQTQGINFIDFNKFFIEHKRKSRYRVYPKGGIHWGEYAVTLAIDSLAKYISLKRGANLQRLHIDSVYFPEELSETDKDISNVMNLLIDPPAYKMPKPLVTFSEENPEKPRILIIGDSYAKMLTTSPLFGNIFGEVEFWYYNKQVQFWYYNKKNDLNESPIHPYWMYNDAGYTKNLDVKNELSRFDVVLLISTETNLFKFDFGFYDAYFYKSQDSVDRHKDYNYYLKRIAGDSLWMVAVKNQAQKMRISIDSSLSKEAFYMESKNFEKIRNQSERKHQMNKRKLKKEAFREVRSYSEEKKIRIKEAMYRAGFRYDYPPY